MSYETIQSPDSVLVVLFWLYSVVFLFLVWEFLRIFRRNGILIGHLRDVFNFLTTFRIWTLNHRGLYTTSVAAVMLGGLLGVVYWAERGHYYFYETEPLFGTVTEFVVWITVLIASGFGQGELPKSFLGVLVTGGLPVFLLGSLFAIVRFTAEEGHEMILDKLARGDIASYRVVVFNYQPKYEGFVHTLLEDTDCFVVLFAKDEFVQEAEGLKENFAETSGKRFRVSVRERTYSDEILFERLDLLEASEIYIFSDMTSGTEYKNSQLLMRINREVNHDERIQHGLRTPPQTVWEVRDSKREQIVEKLDNDEFLESFYPVHFYQDCAEIVMTNFGKPTRSLDQYFGFDGYETEPEWITGESLDTYRFERTAFTEQERTLRRELDDADRQRPTRHQERLSTQQSLVERVDDRLWSSDRSDGDGPVSFYGFVVDIGGHPIPIDPGTAILNDFVEDARDVLYVGADAGQADPDSTGERDSDDGVVDTGIVDMDPSTELVIVNVNENVRYLLEHLEEALGDVDRTPTVTVYYRGDVTTTATDFPVNYVAYESNTDLVNRLVPSGGGGEEGRLDVGDMLLLYLDHDEVEPHLESIKLLDLLDDRFAEAPTIDHADIFLGAESKQGKYGRIYDQMSVDKQIDTFQTQELFLNTLVLLRNSEPVRDLERDGTLTAEEAFDWAVETAYRLRHFVVRPMRDTYLRESGGAVRADRPYSPFSSEFDSSDAAVQPFAGFRIDDDELVDGKPSVEMVSISEDMSIDDQGYLLFLPKV